MKKYKVLLFLIIYTIFIKPKIVTASDFFPQLENLKIGDRLSTEVKELGKEVNDENLDTIFLQFESSSTTYPHFLEINSNNELVYIELKIPDTHLEIYHNLLNSLGEPETKEQTSPSYVLWAYPSKGLGFIVSERNSNFLIQTKYPPKNIEQLKENEAKNFKQTSQQDTLPAGILTPIPTQPAIPKDLQVQQELEKPTKQISLLVIVTYISIGLFIIWLLVGINLYLKNKKTPPPTTTNFPS